MSKQLAIEPTIHENCHIVNSRLGEWTEVGSHNVLSNTQFGDFSYSGSYCMFQNAEVGKFSSIAAFVRIGATDHPMMRPTVHHFTYRRLMYRLDDTDDDAFFKHRANRIVIIGHDTWIGHGALIKPDIKVGIGAVIGQGAVVTKDVPNYAIVAGNPAQLIRYRFDQRTIRELLCIAWWHWPYRFIKERHLDFSMDIRDFIDKYRIER